MMLYPAMSKLNEYVPNRYLLVNVVARRARQISQLAERNEEHEDTKSVTLAINEVSEGKIDAATINTRISAYEYIG